MKIYDAATENVKQGWKRRGANMGILNIDHPDIELFINSKSDDRSIKNFNISVGVTNKFMEALEKGLDWDLINRRTKKIEKSVRAIGLWQKIVKQAWKTGDPGIIFLDTINRSNPLPGSGEIQSANPCGEVPLVDYESCNLGSVNLSKMISFLSVKPEIDFDKLKKVVTTGIRFFG